MITQIHRFNHRLAVRAVYVGAKTARAQMLSLKYSIKPNQPWRAAVVVSKKVSKSAVVRNRIRRRVYEWLRLNESKIPAGTQMIISVYDKSLAKIEHDDLSARLNTLISQIK